MIRDEMEKEYGWSWGVQAGFHAVSVETSGKTTSQRSLNRRSPPAQVESMRHVHLHVISTDFLSPKLKNKKYV